MLPGFEILILVLLAVLIAVLLYLRLGGVGRCDIDVDGVARYLRRYYPYVSVERFEDRHVVYVLWYFYPLKADVDCRSGGVTISSAFPLIFLLLLAAGQWAAAAVFLLAEIDLQLYFKSRLRAAYAAARAPPGG